MTSLLLLLRLVLFALSVGGWCLLLTRKYGLAVELAPVVAFSVLGTAVVAAGLLNVFTPVEWVLYLLGLALFARFVLRDRQAFRPWIQLRVLFFLLGCLWLLWLTKGGLILGHDNMAHWAIIAKRLVTENHLPNTADTAIEFTGYPPGAACWIKYLCDFVGLSDGLMMLAQGLLILSALFSLSAFVPRGCRAAVLPFAAFSVLLLAGNVPLNDLRMDTLLASQGLAGLAAVGFYGSKEPRKALWTALPVFIFLALIKNSGLYFIALDLVVLLWLAQRAKTPRLALAKGALLGLGIPLGAYWLWLRHVALVFPAEAASKHAVSLSGYSAQLSEKTPEQLAQFGQLFRAHFLHFEGRDARCLPFVFLTLAVVLVLNVLCRRLSLSRAALAGFGCLAAEGLYLFSLWCTYKFSMNASEMLVLASIERYHLSALVWLAGAALILCLPLLQRLSALPQWAAGCVLAVLLAMTMVGQKNEEQSWTLSTLYSRAPYHDDSTQGPVLTLKNGYGLTDGSRYLFYTRGGGVDTWTLRYIARYVLNSDTVDFWEYDNQEYSLEDLYANYDYLILYSPDERIDDFLLQNGFDPAQQCIHLVR